MRLLSKLLVMAPTFFVMTMAQGRDMVSTRSFMEENDLWKQDNINERSNVTQELFNKIMDVGKQTYKPFADQEGESLSLKGDWESSTVNAQTSRFFGTVSITVFGGLARRDEVTPDALALVMCHELGHAYGGTPYISSWNKLSAEGQSDYYGAKECLWNVLKIIPEIPEFTQVTPYMETKCTALHGSGIEDYKLCLRQLAAGQALGTLLAHLKQVDVPNYETPDQTVVTETQLSYPATIQCRLDCYHNGALRLDRPACWFKN